MAVSLGGDTPTYRIVRFAASALPNHLPEMAKVELSLHYLFDSNCLERAPDSDTGCLDMTGSQQFVDNSERHYGIGPLDRV
jgi:hypothetical protein